MPGACRLVFAIGLVLLVGCAPSRRLVVQLSTDYTPLVDFGSIEVEAPAGEGTTVVPVHARGGYASAARLIDRVGAAVGATSVRVTLRRPDGTLLAVQDRRVVVGEDTTYVTVRVSRSCAGVTCDRPDARACLAGMCTDDRCTPENPSACPMPACRDASSCPAATVPCAVAQCAAEGVCVVAPDDARCTGSDEVCDVARGCIAAPPSITACFEDDFDDGTFDDWMNLDGGWSIVPAGPDGSDALAVTMAGAGNTRLTHAMLRGITPATIAFSFRLDDGIDGDFDLYLVSGSWTDPDATSRYDIGIHAVGSDNVTDFIVRWDGPTMVTLTSTPVSVATGTWHQLEITRATDGALNVRLDGADYMTSPPDATYAPPFDVVVRGYRPAALDDVRVSCAP